MNYGYLDFYISNIDERMDDEIAVLKKHANDITVDYLSYRPNFYTLMEQLAEGDTLYAYNIARFSSGLRDLNDTLKILNEKKINFVSIMDDIRVDQSKLGQATLNALLVAETAITADPLKGFYK